MNAQKYTCWILCCLLWSATSMANLSLEPRFTDSERFGETFTASFLGDDESVFLFQYIFSNAGIGDRKGACRLLTIPAGEKGQNYADRVDSDGWRFNASKNELSVGSCTLQSTKNAARFSIRIDGVRATLAFEKPLERLKVPTPRGPEGFFEMEVLARGTPAQLSFKGKKGTRNIRGFAYMDHTRSTAKMSELVSEVYRIRILGQPSMRLYQFSKTKTGVRAWTLRDQAARIEKIVNPKISFGGSNERPTLDLDHSDLALGLKTQKLLYRYRPVEAYGFVGRLAAPVIGNPETATFLVKVRIGGGAERIALMERTIISP